MLVMAIFSCQSWKNPSQNDLTWRIFPLNIITVTVPVGWYDMYVTAESALMFTCDRTPPSGTGNWKTISNGVPVNEYI